MAIGNFSLSGTNGYANTAVGHNAGKATAGIENTFLGYASGWENNGSGNVFVGHKAGFHETGSNKLYIENSSSTTPLIYGDFDYDKVGINTTTPTSTFEIAGTMGAKIKNSQIAGQNHPDGTAIIWRYTSGGGLITLPSASSCPNRMYMILNQSLNSMMISTYTNLANTSVDSIASLSSILVISDGAGWFQIK